jgi:hypothetical protein
LLLPLQHFSLGTPLARNDHNPKTFLKEREIHRPLAARLTTPSLLPSLKDMQKLVTNRNLIPSLIPSLLHIVAPFAEA